MRPYQRATPRAGIDTRKESVIVILVILVICLIMILIQKYKNDENTSVLPFDKFGQMFN